MHEKNLAVITINGRLFHWQIHERDGPQVVRADQCLLSLLQSQKTKEMEIRKLCFMADGAPLIVTSAGKSFVFSPAFGTWVQLTDQENPLYGISNYSSVSREKGPLSQELPLMALNKMTPVNPNLEEVSSSLRSLANISYCETQRISAHYLKERSRIIATFEI